MSITVAVSAAAAAAAADSGSSSSPNGPPQTVVRRKAQPNGIVPAYGSTAGRLDEDDASIVLAERHEQFIKDYENHLIQKQTELYCNLPNLVKDKEPNEDYDSKRWKGKWNSLISYIRTVYRMAMDGVEVERYPPHSIFKEAALQSKNCDSYHVFQNVENIVMEFVLEARARQVKILRKKDKDKPEMPQVFVFCLLDTYRRLMAATDHLHNVIKPIEEYHLSKFNLTWRMMNQYLYHSRLYADRAIYSLVTSFIEQILSNSLAKTVLSANLIQDYTKFVKEVKLNINEWAEARNRIDSFKSNRGMLDEEFSNKEKGVFCLTPASPSDYESIIDFSTPTPPLSPAPEYQERIENDECEELFHDKGSNYCDCLHDTPFEDSEQIAASDEDDLNVKFSNDQDNVEINSLTFSYAIIKEKMLSFYLSKEPKPFINEPLLKPQKLVKKVLNIDVQSKSKPVVNTKCPSTNDKNVTCKVEVEQLAKRRHPYYSQGNKPTEPTTKPINRSVHGHSCHKHTEHVKRMHQHDETSECSSGRSSQDDSCSERSTSSPRQCDCCYCEVFGHGVPSVAPVSRNYQEMRDRLRNIYLLKKAKQNVNTDATKQKEANVQKPVPAQQTSKISQPNDKSDVIKGQLKKSTESFDAFNTSSEKTKLQNDNNNDMFDKPIDELVNFIEGNKAINEKRAAKKARRREKKEEEERIKKEEEEAERKRIEEEERKKQEIERRKYEELLKKEKKKGKNQNKNQKQNQQQKQQSANSKSQQIPKQQVQQQNSTQVSKKKNKQSQGNSKETLAKKDEKSKIENVDSAKMVTVKTASDSSKVTITFRGSVEDDVLCTLYDKEAIKAIQRLCDESKQTPQNQAEEKGNKKRSRNRKKKQTEQSENQLSPKPAESVLITNKNLPKPPSNIKWYCSPMDSVSNVANSVQSQPNTVLIKRTNNNQVLTRQLPPQPSQPLPLTSPTAIQINDAVNKIYSSPAPVDINKLQLPPGITITKLDPSDYKPPRNIQQATEKPKQTPLHFPFASSGTITPFGMQQSTQNNVVVVKTDGHDYEETSEWSGAANKRNRRRKKTNGCNIDDTNTENIQPGFTITNKSTTRDPCREGKIIAGQIPTNTPRTTPLPVIIQRHGGIVTIRNPLYQRNDEAILSHNDPHVNGGDDDDTNPSGKRRRRRRRVKGGSKQTDVEESVFEPKDVDLEDGEMDDEERELEAFKRFCLQSVPPQRKEKVHLNIKDIVLKKKSTAKAAAAAVGCV